MKRFDLDRVLSTTYAKLQQARGGESERERERE
jgi:hypothetical protein